eukprot:10623600-Lingulodinium_polyedra.AAC.1
MEAVQDKAGSPAQAGDSQTASSARAGGQPNPFVVFQEELAKIVASVRAEERAKAQADAQAQSAAAEQSA